MQIKENMIGKRIEIRDYHTEDQRFIEDLWFDPQMNRYMGDPLREYADEKYYEALSQMEDNEDGYYLIIRMKDSGERMGTCCMFPDEDRTTYDIGYTIDRRYWRMGYGSEAIQLLIHWIKEHGGKAVTCEVAVDNATSNALIRKMGFSVWKDAEFKKWNMDVKYKSYIYRRELYSKRH